MAAKAKTGNTAVARAEARAATCYATLGANRVRAILDDGIRLILSKHDPVGTIAREFKAEADKGKGTEFLARLHAILDAVASRADSSPLGKGNTFNFNNLMVDAMKQAGSAPSPEPIEGQVIEPEPSGVQVGYSYAEPVDW